MHTNFVLGDNDDSVFIVQSGQLNVFITHPDGTILSLKMVKKGESVTSLLSFIDVLVGNPSVYKTVTAKAVETSQVIRLPMYAFKEVFDENPDILFRVIQVIMIRLQRVTFTALRNYLGLHTELVITKTKKPTNNATTPNPKPPGHRRHGSSIDQTNLGSLHAIEPARPDMLADLADASAATTANRRISSIQSFLDQADDRVIRNIAVDGFIKELGLKETAKEILESNVDIKDISTGEVLLTEGSNEVTLYRLL